ncbi:uncharacterized protein LOC111055597 [Nilaparvata lugens]|uniref:uncharacterized protein LOC111055597 n=1 Tax=Nilaparvata lugens TaxID=108931 RepID=UPI00193EB5AF|nr:uncharacterized protein LOC111055597 [Nilaparvata lugens]
MYCSSDSETKSSSDLLDDEDDSQSSSLINQSIGTTYDSFNLPPRIKTPDVPCASDLLELAELAGVPIPQRLGSIMIQMLSAGASPSGVVSVLSSILNNKRVKRVPNDIAGDSRTSTPASCSRRLNCLSTVTTCSTASDYSVATDYLDRCNLMSQVGSPRKYGHSVLSSRSSETASTNEVVKLVDMLEQWSLTDD